VAAWLIRGTAVSQSVIVSPAVTPDWQIAGVGDLNGDGTADLFWRNQLSGDLTVWLMYGGRLYSAIDGIAVVSSGLPLTWDLAGVGDIDGDGIADLIWRNRDSGDVAVWFMWGFINPDGSGHLIAPVRLALIVASAVPSAWQIAGVRDVDGDGRADIVWRHTQTGDVAVWLMNGATVVRSAVVASSVPLAWRIAKVVDIDGDGKADLVWRHTQNGDVAVWVMDGPVVTQAPVIATGVPLDWQIQ
jgi:FG-GAP-like repeat